MALPFPPQHSNLKKANSDERCVFREKGVSERRQRNERGAMRDTKKLKR